MTSLCKIFDLLLLLADSCIIYAHNVLRLITTCVHANMDENELETSLIVYTTIVTLFHDNSNY